MLLRFEAQQQPINDIKNWLYVILAIIIGPFAYIIWGRRTFMKSLETEVYKLKAEYELRKNLDNDHKQLSNKLLEVLKELATHNEEIRKVLQKFHLL